MSSVRAANNMKRGAVCLGHGLIFETYFYSEAHSCHWLLIIVIIPVSLHKRVVKHTCAKKSD